MSNSQFVLPNFRLKVAEFNTSKLTDLAASLAIAFSENGTTGITFTNINVTNLNAGNITATGMNISTLTGTNLSENFLRFVLATGQSLQLFQSGTQNTFNSNQFYQTPGSNLVLGSIAQITGSVSNLAIGSNSLKVIGNTASSSGNVAVGDSALTALITGANNVAIGRFAGINLSQGNQNVIIGTQTEQSFANSNISQTVVIGYQAGMNMSGSNLANGNVLLGFQAGNNISTGNNNTLLGNSTNVVVGNGTSNSIALGNGSTVGQSNVAVIGNANLTNILPGTGATIDLGISYQPFRNIYFTGSLNSHINIRSGIYTANANDFAIMMTGGSALTLPAVTSLPGPITYKIVNNGATSSNVVTTGSDIFAGTGPSYAAGATTIALPSKFTLSLLSDTVNTWWLV